MNPINQNRNLNHLAPRAANETNNILPAPLFPNRPYIEYIIHVTNIILLNRALFIDNNKRHPFTFSKKSLGGEGRGERGNYFIGTINSANNSAVLMNKSMGGGGERGLTNREKQRGKRSYISSLGIRWRVNRKSREKQQRGPIPSRSQPGMFFPLHSTSFVDRSNGQI